MFRFSTVAGERGAADAERDIRGFAMKFYTDEGNGDLVGNNTPVFFLRDPLKFPDLNHAVKRDHRTDEDYHTQPGMLFRLMKPAQQKVLFENTAQAMGDAPKKIKIRHIGNGLKADPAYGRGVAEALGITLSDVPKEPDPTRAPRGSSRFPGGLFPEGSVTDGLLR